MAEAAEGAQTLKMPDKQLSSEEMQRNKAPLRYVKDWLIFREQSQRRVAEAVGVSEATVSKWLKGSQAVPSDALEEWLAIGRRLGRPLSKAG